MAETLHSRVVAAIRSRDNHMQVWSPLGSLDDAERAKLAHEIISMIEDPSRPFEISSPTSDAWDFQALELARDAIGGQGAAWLGQLKARVQIAIIDGMRQASAKTAVTTRAEEIARVLRICEQYLQGGGGEVWIVRRIMAAIQGRRPLGHDAEKCIACDSPLRNGDLYYPDADGGSLHADCAGPDREGYTKGDGEPLGPNDPIPKPSVWMDDDATTAQPVESAPASAAPSDLRAEIAALIEDAMSESTVDYPAGRDAGHRVEWEEDRLLDDIMAAIGAGAGEALASPVDGETLERLKDAVEGECEGLAISDDQAAAIMAHVASPSVSVESEEYVLVPREPTPEMLEAIRQSADIDGYRKRGGPLLYRAMIAAAPTPNPSPAAKSGEGGEA